jgi:large subunit ribosomal protein L23
MSNIILAPISTEKAYQLSSASVYTFVVNADTTKIDIYKFVESTFSVKVAKVRIVSVKPKKKNFKGKRGIVSGYKKVYVYLSQGMKIDFESLNTGL